MLQFDKNALLTPYIFVENSKKDKVRSILNNPNSTELDVSSKYGVINQSFDKQKIKAKIKKISKIVEELKKIKNG